MKEFHAANVDGFTLIELSIVLVIIGLIVGGVLVGRDLIAASQVRAQISQIEKFNTAKNAFRIKYEALPGDMLPTNATLFGLTAGTGAAYHGDGNEVIESCNFKNVASNLGCESTMFWVHLSQAKLIPQSFNLANGAVTADDYAPGLGGTVTLDKLLPEATIGLGNYFAAFSSSASYTNYFLLAAITDDSGNFYSANATLTPGQAYQIDTKTDDGIPGRGRVLSVGLGTDGSTLSTNNTGVAAQAPGMSCVDAARASYNMSTSVVNTPQCQLLIKMQ